MSHLLFVFKKYNLFAHIKYKSSFFLHEYKVFLLMVIKSIVSINVFLSSLRLTICRKIDYSSTNITCVREIMLE